MGQISGTRAHWGQCAPCRPAPEIGRQAFPVASDERMLSVFGRLALLVAALLVAG